MNQEKISRSFQERPPLVLPVDITSLVEMQPPCACPIDLASRSDVNARLGKHGSVFELRTPLVTSSPANLNAPFTQPARSGEAPNGSSIRCYGAPKGVRLGNDIRSF